MGTKLSKEQSKSIYKHLYTAFWMMAKCESALSEASRLADCEDPVFEGLAKVMGTNCEMLLGIAASARKAAGIKEHSPEDVLIKRLIDNIKL